MPANDFEKQVQQVLDELKLKPSEEVWPQVEQRIRKDKRRRRSLLWLPLLFLLLGGAGYWWVNHKTASGGEAGIAANRMNKGQANPSYQKKDELKKSLPGENDGEKE